MVFFDSHSSVISDKVPSSFISLMARLMHGVSELSFDWTVPKYSPPSTASFGNYARTVLLCTCCTYGSAMYSAVG